ncbi:hypothetical protein [Clostridium septicum]|uniref:Uncharacterized protein n=1 Tax=Clostridium septicum TaxID=1504 RepID=A0A9N7PKJ9_CLOSE|nr:hypothetical protein [Clostridium septicum]AYE35730.1 hypothetical protein CP523_15525 [Clostridium septicum]MDU1314930.1 hypothetical protein [Clostridium septicum]QAS61069.1 hypothetical protein EI377_10235 [Clostridium septicum]UEC19596.1 hypothetical protein LK444_09175 [Clostridium septicum]USS02345.1 hypothetical protein NH397_08005 [Clostridium septicum]
MKKSTLLAIGILVSIIFIITIFTNKIDVYDKKIKHTKEIDAIQDFICYSNVLEEVKNNKRNYYKLVKTNEFYESISRRYRLYLGDNKHQSNLLGRNPFPAFIEYKIESPTDNEINYIKKIHDNSYSTIENYPIPKSIEYFKVTGKYINWDNLKRNDINENGTVKEEFLRKENLNEESIYNGSCIIVIVDEGEGYVVDYYEILNEFYGEVYR